MGGCCAVGCSNHSKNGVRLFQFPRDPERRRIWCLRISRAYWVPSARAELCEAHFEPSQFEQHRADGWKRLKLTAVPSLFPHNKMPLKQLTEQEQSSRQWRKRQPPVSPCDEMPDEKHCKVGPTKTMLLKQKA
ncbi:hypothetical protein V5799_006803 [Amblyomma americanum]|uniref:THAP-type domain-containing protein n=1 Tax=Amblyomma americanum TaxID=6943 RepID=A0AAQ4DVC6_AMBAM